MIGLLGSAAAPVLAGLLAWAGVSSLVQRGRVADALSGLRMPAAVVLAPVVPLVELAVAILLLVQPADGAAAALVLVAASHVALTWWAGGRLPCPRVGSARLDPASWVDVGRNLGLGALGVAALFSGSAVRLPSLPAVVAVTTTVLCGVVLLAAVELRSRLAGFAVAGAGAGAGVSGLSVSGLTVSGASVPGLALSGGSVSGVGESVSGVSGVSGEGVAQ